MARRGERELGITCTWDLGGGEFRTFWRSEQNGYGSGSKRELFDELAERVRDRWPAAVLVSYSTPETIRADLRGRREGLAGHEGLRTAHPEQRATRGRRWLLSRRLWPRDVPRMLSRDRVRYP